MHRWIVNYAVITVLDPSNNRGLMLYVLEFVQGISYLKTKFYI